MKVAAVTSTAAWEGLFSVIIPTHGRPHFLEVAIRSVLAQTYVHWELRIVLDGPDAASRTLCQSFLADGRIQVLEQAQAGPGAARKNASELAKGDFLCYLDDDDYWLPNHLAELAAGIQAQGNLQRLYRTGMLAKSPTGQQTPLPLFNNEKDALTTYWEMPVNLLAYAIPKAAVANCPIDPSKRIIEDFEWLTRLLLHYPAYQLAAYTCVNVQHQYNRTNLLKDPSYLAERLAIVRGLYADPNVQKRLRRSIYRRLLAHHSFHFARQSWLAGAYGFYWLALWQGLRDGRHAAVRESLYTLGFAVKRCLSALKKSSISSA